MRYDVETESHNSDEQADSRERWAAPSSTGSSWPPPRDPRRSTSEMTLPDDIESEISSAIEAGDSDSLRATIESIGLTGHEHLGAWLVLASRLGELDAMRILLDYGASVQWKNDDGETAFSFACACDQFDAAQLLHKHGADINSIDSSGATPLDWAVCHARPAFREWLKQVGGTRNMDHDGWPWPPQTTT